MELFTFVLILHLIGAALAGIIVLGSVWMVVLRAKEWFMKLARWLAYVFGFVGVTGVLLAMLSANTTVLSVCDNLVLYGGIFALTEGLLLWRAEKLSQPLSAKPLITGTTVPALAALLAIVAGF